MIDELLENSHSGRAQERKRACRLLGETGDLRALPRLKELLTDRAQSVRREAALALGRFVDALPIADLAKASTDSDPGVRKGAVRALRRLQHKDTIPALIDRLLDSDDRVVRVAVGSLAVLGEASVESLAVAFQGDDAHLSEMAVSTLERLGPRSFPALPLLLDGIKRHPALVSLALRWHGEAASAALPTLWRLLQRKRPNRIRSTVTMNFSVQGAAALALARISPTERTAGRLLDEFERRIKGDDEIAFEVLQGFKDLPPRIIWSQRKKINRLKNSARSYLQNDIAILEHRKEVDIIEVAKISANDKKSRSRLLRYVLLNVIQPSNDVQLEVALVLQVLGWSTKASRGVLLARAEGVVKVLRREHGRYYSGESLGIEYGLRRKLTELRMICETYFQQARPSQQFQGLLVEGIDALDHIDPLVPDPRLIDEIGATRKALSIAAEVTSQ